VSLARVLAQRSPLLLDEPTAALGLRLSAVRDRALAGDAAVVARHDRGLAAAYANRVYVLAEGKVRSSGRRGTSSPRRC